ncbi:hypothetical protein VP01_515g3 [Puccinia sorghi]|uniref:Uncharacterized protein n=1 Tax=Puccinia sorghi TaxID=27349 RepID=A0A0L6ULN0_9BASI|nr:hypothetical protein VP01_515g3 [Puccinia sorghi]
MWLLHVIQDGIPLEENNTLPLVFSSKTLGRIPNGHTAYHTFSMTQRHLLNFDWSASIPAIVSQWLNHCPSHLLCSLNFVAPLYQEGRKFLLDGVAPLTELISARQTFMTEVVLLQPNEDNKVFQAVSSSDGSSFNPTGSCSTATFPSMSGFSHCVLTSMGS